ncbi:MAG: LuxR family transcriptional regulator, partial [Chloroflexi bacterium]|nr:LuxR family transcriptional regulator [Chloroflexota bacterium]
MNAPERAQLEAAALHGAGDPDRVALLPAPLSSFIGRESERSELVSLARARRLVTLTGAGGIGRTRLAIEVATELQHEYMSGARMVDLATIASPLHVPQAFANAFGLKEETDHPLIDTVSGYLRSRQQLLLVDNCEHLLTACAATVQALLENCRELHVLATSRQPLGIDGEVAWRVPALGLPARDEDFVHAESVRLFGERASAANREFRLTSANAPAVLDVCRRLDGIPLAIELAAARARMFSVEQIAWHLGNQSLAWSSAAHATPARHTTLRAAIEWSYALLTPTEQALFRRLAVFAGSFSLQAAEAVCAGELAAIPDSAEVLCGLIDKSLVLAETRPTGEVRYRLLETLRQYAVERLHEAHEEHA